MNNLFIDRLHGNLFTDCLPPLPPELELTRDASSSGGGGESQTKCYVQQQLLLALTTGVSCAGRIEKKKFTIVLKYLFLVMTFLVYFFETLVWNQHKLQLFLLQHLEDFHCDGCMLSYQLLPNKVPSPKGQPERT